jgi:hypothetical protein
MACTHLGLNCGQDVSQGGPTGTSIEVLGAVAILRVATDATELEPGCGPLGVDISVQHEVSAALNTEQPHPLDAVTPAMPDNFERALSSVGSFSVAEPIVTPMHVTEQVLVVAPVMLMQQQHAPEFDVEAITRIDDLAAAFSTVNGVIEVATCNQQSNHQGDVDVQRPPVVEPEALMEEAELQCLENESAIVDTAVILCAPNLELSISAVQTADEKQIHQCASECVEHSADVAAELSGSSGAVDAAGNTDQPHSTDGGHIQSQNQDKHEQQTADLTPCFESSECQLGISCACDALVCSAHRVIHDVEPMQQDQKIDPSVETAIHSGSLEIQPVAACEEEVTAHNAQDEQQTDSPSSVENEHAQGAIVYNDTSIGRQSALRVCTPTIDNTAAQFESPDVARTEELSKERNTEHADPYEEPGTQDTCEDVGERSMSHIVAGEIVVGEQMELNPPQQLPAIIAAEQDKHTMMLSYPLSATQQQHESRIVGEHLTQPPATTSPTTGLSAASLFRESPVKVIANHVESAIITPDYHLAAVAGVSTVTAASIKAPRKGAGGDNDIVAMIVPLDGTDSDATQATQPEADAQQAIGASLTCMPIVQTLLGPFEQYAYLTLGETSETKPKTLRLVAASPLDTHIDGHSDQHEAQAALSGQKRKRQLLFSASQEFEVADVGDDKQAAQRRINNDKATAADLQRLARTTRLQRLAANLRKLTSQIPSGKKHRNLRIHPEPSVLAKSTRCTWHDDVTEEAMDALV